MQDALVRDAADALTSRRRLSVTEALFCIEARAFVLGVPVADVAAYVRITGSLPALS